MACGRSPATDSPTPSRWTPTASTNPADIEHVHTASRRQPRALFSGKPVFGADVPAARLHGRKVTNLLARIEAGSAAIEDAMCGFRVYPVAPVLPLADAIGARVRMEFDIEILVRAAWAGLPLRFFPTRVAYPAGGRSHFRIVDNLRLSGMHTVLLWQRLVQALSQPKRSTQPT